MKGFYVKKIIFGLLLMTSVVVAAEDWPYVCEQPSIKQFADKRYFGVAVTDYFPLILVDTQTLTIDKKNKIIKVWTIWVSSYQGRQKAIDNFGDYGDCSDYGYHQQLIFINYQQMRHKMEPAKLYGCNGDIIRARQFVSTWEDIVPGSVIESMAFEINKKYNLK